MYCFSDDNENTIQNIEKSVTEKANYDLRKIFGAMKRVNDKVDTGKKNEFGEPIQDWDKVSTKELRNYFSEMNALNFFASPIRMRAFIESSLGSIIYNFDYNSKLTDPSVSGTVAIRQAIADMNTMDSRFALRFREMYSNYVTEILKSFDQYIRRLEKIIDWRLADERYNANRNPFK